MSVKGAYLRCLGGSCLLQNTEQGRPGGGGGGGGGLGLLGREDPPAHPSLGWGICPTFSLWLWDGPLFLPGELLELAPPGPLGRGALTPSSQKGHGFSMATAKAAVWGLMWPTPELSVDLGRVRPTPAAPAGMWRQGLAG